MIVIDGVEMVDVQEGARLARRAPETVRRWVWSGRLASVKHGNKLFVPKAAVQAEDEQERRQSPGLAAWAEQLDALPPGTPGSTASDLIYADRSERAGR